MADDHAQDQLFQKRLLIFGAIFFMAWRWVFYFLFPADRDPWSARIAVEVFLISGLIFHRFFSRTQVLGQSATRLHLTLSHSLVTLHCGALGYLNHNILVYGSIIYVLVGVALCVIDTYFNYALFVGALTAASICLLAGHRWNDPNALLFLIGLISLVVPGIYSVFRGISLKTKLTDSNSSMNLVLSSSSAAICLFDLDLRPIFQNTRFMTLSENYDLSVSDSLISTLLQRLQSESIVEIPQPLLLKKHDPSSADYWVRGRAVRVKLSGVDGYLFTLIDVNQQVHTDLQLRITGQLAAIGRMAGDIAHEINNPMTAIIGWIQRAARYAGTLPDSDELVRQKIQEALSQCEEVSYRVTKISNSLRILHKGGSKDKDKKNENLVASVLAPVICIVQEKSDRLGVKLTVNCPSNLRIYAREGEIIQILMNLINNAIDASSETPRGAADPEPQVVVTVSNLNEGGTCIEIADTGSGVPPDKVDLLFKTSFSTKPTGQGTGLGLPLSQRLASENGGTIQHLRSDGKTRFLLKLPAGAEFEKTAA